MLREAKTATLLSTSTGIFVVRLWLLDVFFFSLEALGYLASGSFWLLTFEPPPQHTPSSDFVVVFCMTPPDIVWQTRAEYVGKSVLQNPTTVA